MTCIRSLLALAIIAAVSMPAFSQAAPSVGNQVDLQMVTCIRQEGFHHSKVMDIEADLTDRLGARLTGSEDLIRANEWTRDQLTSFGLQNSHLESYHFGRGWALDNVYIRMTAPSVAMLYALPKAWTPATNGIVKGQIVHLKATTIEELAKEKGKYAGKIVLISPVSEITPQTEAANRRYDDAALHAISEYQIPGVRMRMPGGPVFNMDDLRRRFQFQRALTRFLDEEKPAMTIEASHGDAGLLFVQGTQAYKDGSSDGYPQLVMLAEQYNRLARLVDRNVPVEVEASVQAHFENPNNGDVYNTVAEIPGSDKRDEIVMVGGHLDSWHAGTGATDDAAGVAVAMEAVRILQVLGVKPRRTIRIGLWSGEEQGLLGSRAYVTAHFGKRDEPAERPGDLPSYMRPQENLPLHLKPEQAKISAYFNIDNGTGRLRGIYTQENSAVVPLFQSWGRPLRDIGFTTVTQRNTGGTDHLSFDTVGIPAFQFIQDPVEYMSRTHHSNMDVYDRAQREDLMQASVVLASFLYNAAMRDEMLPRKPLPPGAVMESAPAPAPAVKEVPKGKKSPKR